MAARELRMHNAETGEYRPAPADPKAVMALKVDGFAEVEMLVDTSLGREVPIACEEQTQGYKAVERCLGKTRRDEGHKGQPAFMRPAQWKSLSAAEREAFKPKPRPVDETLIPSQQRTEALALSATTLAAQEARIRELEARLASTQQGARK